MIKILKTLLVIVIIVPIIGLAGFSIYKLVSTQIKYSKDGGLGNSQTNIMNGGIMAKYNNFLYYSNTNDNGKLYKSHLDGTNSQKLSDDENISFINAYEDWIFYVDNTEGKGNHIIKIKPNGTERTKVNNLKTGQLIVVRDIVGGYILWYISMNDGWKLTVQANDSPNVFQNKDVLAFTVDASDSKLYYTTSKGIYWVRTIGFVLGNTIRGNKFLDGTYSSIVFSDNNLFYNKIADTRHYLSFKKTGTSAFSTTTNFKGFEYLSGFDYGVTKKYIIYFNEKDKTLCRMKTNGKEIAKISHIEEVDTSFNTVIQIIDNTVYLYFKNKNKKLEVKSFKIE